MPTFRIFFDYEKLRHHPEAVFEGVLPLKIKNEVKLKDYVRAIIIPEAERENIECAIPDNLGDRVVFVKNDCKDIWEWSEKVYEIAKHFNRIYS